jgi:hypothetical protein
MLYRVDGHRRLWRMLCRCYHPHRFYGFTTLLAAIVLSAHVLGSVVWGCLVEGPPSHFLVVCLYRWDFAGNPWITHESYVFSHFYLMKNVPMHAFEKKETGFDRAAARCRFGVLISKAFLAFF